jgi:hypothetical protein
MFAKKRIAAASFLGLVLCTGLFAQNILDTYFDGDELNRRVRNYAINVSNLIPDSTTLSNVWASPPPASFMYGFGVNGSITILDRKKVSALINDVDGFGGSHKDLSQFPEAIPFLPGAAFDARVGFLGFDMGLCGMWVDSDILSEELGDDFLGQGSTFYYRSFGIDFRTVVIREKSNKILFNIVTIPSAVAQFLPTLTFQAGYYFTWLSFGIEAGNEKVNADFRNDSYLLALQASYDLVLLNPYVGVKMIFSKTDSGFSWETDRPVKVNGSPYPDGAKYNSGGVEGDTFAYFQIYGGLGLSLALINANVGFAYNIVTEHFGVNFSVRYVLGI